MNFSTKMIIFIAILYCNYFCLEKVYNSYTQITVKSQRKSGSIKKSWALIYYMPFITNVLEDSSPQLHYAMDAAGLHVSFLIAMKNQSDLIVMIFIAVAAVYLYISIKKEGLIYIYNFDNYKLVRKIDKGGMGIVFAAKHMIENRFYAMKVIRKSAFFSNPQKSVIDYKIACCDLEVQMMLKFAYSTHVVRSYEAFQTQYHLVIVMPLYEAGSLWQQLFVRSKFSETEVAHFAYQLVKALNFLHSQGVIHNDVKPDNVLIKMDGYVQLTDFGNAQVGMVKGEPHEFDAGGTPGYMAPEVLFNIPCTHVVDFWSLGVTLFVLCHHSYPYPMCDANTFNVGEKVEIEEKMEDYIQLVEYCERHGVSDEFYDFLSALLEVSPDDRIGSVNSPHGMPENHIFIANLNPIDRYIPTQLEILNNIDDPVLSAEVIVQKFEQKRLKEFESFNFPNTYFKVKPT